MNPTKAFPLRKRRLPSLPLAAGVLALLLLAGCARRPATEGPEAPAGAPGLPLQELVEGALHPPADAPRPPILDRLDRPLRVEETPQENIHVPGQIDTLRTLYYDGLQVSVYDVSGTPKEIITGVAVTGERYRTAEGLRVGSTRAEVEAALGQPDERRGGAYVYELDDVTPNLLFVHFRGDIVSELGWSFYYD